MRTNSLFASVMLLASMANAEDRERIVAIKTNTSDEHTLTVLDTTELKFYLDLWSVYNEDRDELKLRALFDLYADILQTDSVVFTLSFSTDLTNANRYLLSFAEDAGQCTAVVSTDDD